MAHHVLWNKENRRVSPPATFISFPVTDVEWVWSVWNGANRGHLPTEQPAPACPGAAKTMEEVQKPKGCGESWCVKTGTALSTVPGALGLGRWGAALRGGARGADAFSIALGAASPRGRVLLQCKCRFLQFIHLKRHFSNKINHYFFFFLFISKYIYSIIKNIILVHRLPQTPSPAAPPSPSPSPRPLSCPGFLLPSSPCSAFPLQPDGRPRHLPFWDHFAQTALFWGTGAGVQPRRCQLGCSLGSRPFCSPVLRRQVVRKPMSEAVYSESCGLLFFFLTITEWSTRKQDSLKGSILIIVMTLILGYCS